MKIYLIRHGKTKQNELGILQGAGIDSDLSETGRSQARDRIFSIFCKYISDPNHNRFDIS